MAVTPDAESPRLFALCLQQAYGDHYLYAGRSRLDDGRRHAMDQEDLRDYQEIKRRNLISFGRRTAADQEW